VRVRPWARVYVDGKPRGETPLDPFPVPAGKHTVLLVNDQLAAKRTYNVEVHPHEQTEVKSLLDEK
jgi:serine/threonine-protein kinase